jgi:hypothetical protein
LETFCSLSFFFVRSEKLLFLMVEEKKKGKVDDQILTRRSRPEGACDPIFIFGLNLTLRK